MDTLSGVPRTFALAMLVACRAGDVPATPDEDEPGDTGPGDTATPHVSPVPDAPAPVALRVPFDLTGDGAPDLLVGGRAPQVVPLGPEGPRFDAGVALPVAGTGYDSAVADVDGDGLLDIVLPRIAGEDEAYDTTSYVLHARATAPPTWDVVELPTSGAHAVSVGDVDRDGWPDLVVSNHATGNPVDAPLFYAVDSAVFLGSADGFDAARRVDLPTQGAFGNALADLDRDGWLDVVFSNYYDGRSRRIASYVYWGGDAGFSADRRTDLPTIGARDVGVYDVDGDGWRDLVFACHYDDATMETFSLVYWNGPEGIDATRYGMLPTHGAHTVAVHDLDVDGRLDLVLANQRGDPTWSVAVPTWLVPGGDEGWDTSRRVELEPAWASSLVAGDLDGDGWPDLLAGVYYPPDRIHAAEVLQGVYVRMGGPDGLPAAPTYVDVEWVTSLRAFADEQGF